RIRIVDRAHNDFLAGSTLAEHEYMRSGGGQLFDDVANLADLRRLSHQTVGGVHVRVHGLTLLYIQPHHESLTFWSAFASDPFRQRVGGLFGRFVAHQHPPHGCTAGARHYLCRAVAGGHLSLQLLGCLPAAVGGNLHREVRHRQRPRRTLDDLDPDARRARPDHRHFLGGAMRQVDDASVDERPAVDDLDIDRLAGIEIVDPYPGMERQCAMSGHQLLHVVDLAVGRLATVVRMTVPAGDALFGIAYFGFDFRSACGGRGWPRQPDMLFASTTGQYQTHCERKKQTPAHPL